MGAILWDVSLSGKTPRGVNDGTKTTAALFPIQSLTVDLPRLWTAAGICGPISLDAPVMKCLLFDTRARTCADTRRSRLPPAGGSSTPLHHAAAARRPMEVRSGETGRLERAPPFPSSPLYFRGERKKHRTLNDKKGGKKSLTRWKFDVSHT